MTVYDKIAESFVDADKEVEDLFARKPWLKKPKPEPPSPFMDYFRKKKGEEPKAATDPQQAYQQRQSEIYQKYPKAPYTREQMKEPWYRDMTTEKQKAWEDYQKAIAGPMPAAMRAVPEFLMTGLEQASTATGALLTAPARPRPEGTKYWETILPLGYKEFLPGGKQYEAYTEWRDKGKDPAIPALVPSWKQLGAWLKPVLRDNPILRKMNVDVEAWEEPDEYEMARMGMAETAEFVPWLFLGAGRTAKTTLEKAGNITVAQIKQGKTAEEALNIAFNKLAKKGQMPKYPLGKIAAEAEVPVVKPAVAPPMAKAPPAEVPVVKPPVEAPPATPTTRLGLTPQLGPVLERPDATTKLTELVKSAKPVRAETEILKHETLSKRVGAAAGVLEQGEARQAFQRSKAMLKGELPQAHFTPPEVGLTPENIDGLFQRIRTSKELPYFQKINTDTALEKVLLGQLPTRGEIALLEEVFGTDFAKAILSKRAMGEKAWELFLEIWNIPRAMLAAGELSASLRQGAVLAPKHYKDWGRSFRAQLRAAAKADNAQATDRAIRTGPGAERRAIAELYHAPLGGVGSKLTAREEVWVSTLLQRFAGWWEKTGVPKKIITAPLYPVAKGVQVSERAYITMLNKLRADSFDSTVAYWEKIGFEATIKNDRDLAKFINNATGRGSLGKLEESAPFLSGVFFSPRLQASRIRLVESLFSGTAPVRKEAALSIAAFVGTGLLVLGLADLAGAEVGINPLSADFGKIRIGKTRLDIWGGFQQYARFISTLITGMRKSSITGQTYEKNRMEIVQQFVRSKLMPTISIVYDLLEGRTYIGEEMKLDAKQLYQRLAFMFVQDITDAIEAEGLVGGLIAAPGALGIGIVSYDLPNWPELEQYFKLKTTKERTAYRLNNPENEAKLFILGRFTTLKTPQARQHVLRLMQEHKIKPEDVRGYEKVFGPQPIAEGLPAVTWETIRGELGSSLLKALDRLWYKGGTLTEEETTKLQQIHWKYPLGQTNFNAWVKQTLRQFFENANR